MSIQVTFRTLKGSTFKLDAQPSDTVLDLKRKVAEHQKVDDFAAYRLIHKGKILADDATVTSASITNVGFVVVMPPKKQIAKPAKPTLVPAAAPVAAAAADPPAAAAPAAPPAPASSTSAAPTASTPSAPTTATPAPASGPAESLVMGAAYEASVKRIMEMGFPEEQVKRAMRAAFNNPDRAVEFIFNGIPDIPDASPGAPPAAPSVPATPPVSAPTSTARSTQTARSTAPSSNPPPASRPDAPGTPFNMFEPATAGAGARTSDSADMPSSGSGLDVLRNNPQFTMIRRLIQANPAVLPQILQQLESANPALMELINANQDEFTRLLNEPLPQGDEAGDEAMEQLSQMMANSGGPGAGPGPGQIYVTEEENQQITRLTELGASIGLERAHVVETWLACNRDETLAANFLVDHADELRADQAEEQAANSERTNQPDGEQGPGGPPS